ncbi:hypothetical protein [Streptomyces sp. NPDC057877]|uniref:hypothetical protein n=1 Tax=Streptomyces sp. NPDC057877 TaxID=3346269 RepID=UPI0036867975
MEHADSIVESDLLDLGGVTLDQLRAITDRERADNKQRLLRKLEQPDVNFGGEQS